MATTCETPEIIKDSEDYRTNDLITTGLDLATERATDAYSTAIDFLGDITGAVNSSIASVGVNFDNTFQDIPDIDFPDAPEEPSINITVPNLPTDYEAGEIYDINLNAIGTLPTFTESAPTISLPNTPVAFTATFDTDAPTIQTDFDFPDAVSYTLPSVPTFEDLAIPDTPTLDIPTFDQLLPSASSVDVPSVTFYWDDEDVYSAELLDAVQVKLLDWVENGGTGLPTNVEQAIYDRARNREDINSVRSEQQVLIEQASRGFSRPQGSTLAALDMAAQETQNKVADLSREIMIKQAELEQSNMQFAIQQTIALEQLLITEHQQIQQRSFEAAKYTQEVAIQIFNAELSKVNLALEAYKSYAAAYEARVRAALANVEIFKAEIQAQALISEINKDEVALYNAQLDAIKTSVDIYKTEVDAVSSQLQAEGLKVENFKGLIQAYAAQIEAKKAEYIGFSEAVKGELAKVNIYDSQVRAFIGRVDAYGKSVDTQSALVSSDIETEKLRLQTYLGKLDAVVKQIQSEASVYSTQVDVYRGQSQVYSAQIGAREAANRLAIQESELEARIAKSQADVALKNAEINIQNVYNNNQLRLQAAMSGADVAKGLAQASLSALNIGATLSSNRHVNTAYQNQRSRSSQCTEEAVSA